MSEKKISTVPLVPAYAMALDKLVSIICELVDRYETAAPVPHLVAAAH